MTKKFSIVTPSFNQGQYIRETIESVLNQNYPSIEHIVMDGGSTDETVEILKSYSHLNWVSEKDGGQSDALNKGFAKITGDYVGWVNSDDWFAPNIFGEIAEALEKHPIVMGACELRDENNQTMYVVPNIERTWFDILKYWKPYSIPTQPSIFMRRDFLELARRPDGNFFDAELYYCMDYDLWMRLLQHKPLSVSLPKPLSYYRMTAENQTGEKTDGMPYAEPEMSRIFNRYKDIAFPTYYPISIVVPVFDDSSYETALSSLLEQQISSSEIIVCPVALNNEKIKELKTFTKKLNGISREKQRDYYARVIPNEPSFSKAVNMGITLGAGSISAVLGCDLEYPETIVAQVLNLMNKDSIGGVTLTQTDFGCFIRKIAAFEQNGFKDFMEARYSRQSLMEDCLKTGWHWKQV